MEDEKSGESVSRGVLGGEWDNARMYVMDIVVGISNSGLRRSRSDFMKFAKVVDEAGL
jgi:hypothetical protein